MKKLKILCVFILNVHFLFAQKNCFEDCWENFKYSNTDISIRGAQILQGLVGCTTPGFNTQTINGESISLEQLNPTWFLKIISICIRVNCVDTFS